MIFLDTDTLSFYFAGDNNIKEKIIETINKGEQICLFPEFKDEVQ